MTHPAFLALVNKLAGLDSGEVRMNRNRETNIIFDVGDPCEEV